MGVPLSCPKLEWVDLKDVMHVHSINLQHERAIQAKEIEPARTHSVSEFRADHTAEFLSTLKNPRVQKWVGHVVTRNQSFSFVKPATK